jgi:beta-galactosidase/beta-glucuronidase
LVNNCSGWYRKHFSLPAEWAGGGATWVYFEGVHHYSYVWLNGKPLGQHINGYLSFWYRLDTNGAKFGKGDANNNMLAVYANSDPGSGMYGYHGGGLTRHQWLVHTASPAFIPPEEAWVHTLFRTSSRIIPMGSTPAAGLTATEVELVAEGAVSAAAGPVKDVWVTVEFLSGSSTVAKSTVGPLAVGVDGKATSFTIRATPSTAVALWSVARPALHTARFTVHMGGANAPATDVHNVTFGVRETKFDPNHGFFLNRQHVKLRGFCDFGPFGAVGAATPDRVHLFRAQVLRSVGANAWRMVSVVYIRCPSDVAACCCLVLC